MHTPTAQPPNRIPLPGQVVNLPHSVPFECFARLDPQVTRHLISPWRSYLVSQGSARTLYEDRHPIRMLPGNV
jgi:hypothetical protein